MEKLTLAKVLKRDATISTRVLHATTVSPTIEKTKEQQKRVLNLKNLNEENLRLVVRL